MNAAKVAVILFATAFSRDLCGNQFTLKSQVPIPASLHNAIDRELSLAGLREPGQPNIYVEIHGTRLIPVQPLVATERPLGWVNVVDGEILSIIQVDCERIGQTLRRVVPDAQSVETQELMARAIVRVIRHELRHLILKTVDHEKLGDFKSSLQAEELIASFANTGRRQIHLVWRRTFDIANDPCIPVVFVTNSPETLSPSDSLPLSASSRNAFQKGL